MNEDVFKEMEELRLHILGTGRELKKLLEKELEEGERELAKIRIRKKYWYFVPDFILKFFYSEFKLKGEKNE